MKRKNKTIKYVLSAALIIVIFAAGFMQYYPMLKSKDDSLSIDDSNQRGALAGLDDVGREEEGTDQTEQPTDEQVPQEELNTARKETDYLTYSNNGNIDIGVIFMNPITGDNESLMFKVMMNTHSVDLTQYGKLTDFIELQTDNGLISGEDFEWTMSSSESHHVSGILKIKNSSDGSPIYTRDTKSLKLVFKDIGAEGEREHLYQGDTLR